MATDQEIHDRIHYQFKQFLTGHVEGIHYLEEAVKSETSRLIIPVDRLTAVNDRFFASIVVDPFTFIPPCEAALQSVFPTDLLKGKNGGRAHLGFSGWLESHRMVTPRQLNAYLLHQIVAVEGIVTKCSLVRPKAVESVLYCGEASEGKRVTSRQHNDTAAIKRDKFSVNILPQQNEEGFHYSLEAGLSTYKDCQRFSVQEMPECAPTGQLPRSVDVVVEEDLVDVVKPGDRVRVHGVYRSVPIREGSKVTGHTRAFVVGNNIEQLRSDHKAPKFTPQEIRQIEEIACRPDTFSILSRSISPAIYGNDLVKRGLLLQLLGGIRKECINGMRLRGDIHVLLVGDPSCGKSQMLRFIMNIAPLALSTTGRGSSGVGLTAAVTVDQDTNERRLEAGAMVLADGGIVCIDEFDKMSDEDRVAIHEVMEQQTVTISKAGIQTSLNARCSVTAAANPVYGNFDEERDLKSQVNFPDSLLSRFDLIFVVRDPQTAEEDRNICQQVLRQLQMKTRSSAHTHKAQFSRNDDHTHNTSNIGGVGISDFLFNREEAKDTSVWQNDLQGDGQPTLTVAFLKKYLYYCKHTDFTPTLTDQARQEVSDFYADIRQRIMRSNENSSKILATPTPRSLEACIRLATAHAKLKMRKHITTEDVRKAKQLLLWTLCGERPDLDNDESEAEEEGEEGERN
eukprot:GHVN01024427.1.p1 GENE.GHVN01024427.1~~GHVN01024427.1.p1  ORF type:complete len:681 (+),score=104.76 GHVN01024427.1:278-2320(+)